MPAGGEDVSEEGKGRFMFCTWGKGEGVEIGKGDAEVLGLGCEEDG